MKLLIVSDEISTGLYDYFKKEKLNDVDLILSCGDLPARYLEFLVTMGHAPLYYVPGNHDDAFKENPPDGCICIDEDVVSFRGLRIAGLGGSIRYKQNAHYMYDEKQQRKRLQKLKRKIDRYNGIDIMLTHAPLHGIGDGDDFPHRGFDCFYEILDIYKPMYFIHGHQHLNYGRGQRMAEYGETCIVNGYISHVIEIDDSDIEHVKPSGSFLYDFYMKLKTRDRDK